MADIKMNIINSDGKIGMNVSAQKIYPPLENLEATPSGVEQVFNHPNSYGYDKVTVKAVASDTLNITPTTESQEYTGLYGTVNVGAVNSSIDSDIKAENIKDGIEILGIEGNLKAGTFITKTINENGTYDATDDDADGYSQVTVNVVPYSEYIVTLENLHDSSTDIQNVYINANTGEIVNYNGWVSTDYIEIAGQVAVNFLSKEWQYCAVYDENKKFIRNLQSGLNSALTPDVKYIRFSGIKVNMQKLCVYPSTNTTNCIVPAVIDEPLALGDFNINIESLIQILNNLADRTGQTRYILTLGDANLEKLTAEQKAIATSKNWTLV